MSGDTHTRTHSPLRRTADNGINKCATNRISRIKTSSFSCRKVLLKTISVASAAAPSGCHLLNPAANQLAAYRPSSAASSANASLLMMTRAAASNFHPSSNRTICKSINYARKGERETAIYVQAEATAIIIVVASRRGMRSFSLVRNMRFPMAFAGREVR